MRTEAVSLSELRDQEGLHLGLACFDLPGRAPVDYGTASVVPRYHQWCSCSVNVADSYYLPKFSTVSLTYKSPFKKYYVPFISSVH